jgi:transposase
VIDERGELVVSHPVRTQRRTLLSELRSYPPTRVVLETGSETSWLSRLIGEAGHQAWPCHARRLRMIAESTLKCDRLDSEILARLSRLSTMDEKLVPAVHLRAEETELVRTVLRVRSALVKQRTACVNSARGLARSQGHRLPGVKPPSLPRHVKCSRQVPDGFKGLLAPLLDNVERLTETIEQMDEQVVQIGALDPVVKRLQTIDGVGPLTALAFVTCIEDPTRFAKSRSVGSYLGLRPRLRASADMRHEGRITKAGDGMLRHLLGQAAHALLNSKKESELRTWGLSLERRVGRPKAVTAIARKLAVLMHRLWVSEQNFRRRADQAAH